jgi:hypothetical protein
VPRVEVWHGLERVDERPPLLPAPAPAPASAPAASAPAAPAPRPVLPSATSEPGGFLLPPLSFKPPEEPRQAPARAAGPALTAGATRLTSLAVPAREPAAAPAAAAPTPTSAPAPSPQPKAAAPQPQPAATRPAPAREVRPAPAASRPLESTPAPTAPGQPAGHAAAAQPGGNLLYRVALVQMLSILGALVLGPLVLLAALCYLLRRYASSPGALFRVEVVNSLPPGMPLVMAGPGAGQGAARHSGLEIDLDLVPDKDQAEGALEGVEESTAEPFELGPSFEEERQLQEAAAQQAEEALLRHIFAQNVRLREQIEELDGAAGPGEVVGNGPEPDAGACRGPGEADQA